MVNEKLKNSMDMQIDRKQIRELAKDLKNNDLSHLDDNPQLETI